MDAVMALDARDTWVVRPRDLDGLWARPAKELARLADRGVTARVAHGYYAVVPADWRARGGWVPAAEELALAVGVCDYGEDAALCHLAAARVLGAVPRALGAADVVVPKQRPPLETVWGRTVRFLPRAAGVVETMRLVVGRVEGMVTTPEQTIVDLVRWPRRGGADVDALGAARVLTADADLDRVMALAGAQRATAAVKDFLAATSWQAHTSGSRRSCCGPPRSSRREDRSAS